MNPCHHRPKTCHPLHPLRAWAAVALALTLATGSASAAVANDAIGLSLEQLMQITVVGAAKYEQKQSEVAAAVSVITRRDILTFGWRTLDEALASLPGVHTSYDRQYTYLGARGFGLPGDYTTRMLVTVNGNRLNDPTYDSGPAGRNLPLDVDLIDRIEFIPGPGGAVYGQNAMFGVVNIVTRRGAAIDGTELGLSMQSPQGAREGRLNWGRRFGDGTDVVLAASALRTRGQDLTYDFGAAGVTGVARGLDRERDQKFFASVARGPWSADLTFGDRRKDDPTGVFLSDPLVPGQYQGERYALMQAQYHGRFDDDRWELVARGFAGQHRYRSQLTYGTDFYFPTNGDWHGAELRLISTAWAGHKLMLGIEAQDTTHQDQLVFDLSNPANDLAVTGSGWRMGSYLQDEWRLTDTLTATLGLRVDRGSVSTARSSPRAALIWQAGAATTLKALYGRAHRAPNAYERDYGDGLTQIANPSLGGERIDTLELVADHRVSRSLAVRAAAYQWAMRDLITLGTDAATGVPQYRSGEHVQARGLELSADQTWDRSTRLRVSGSYQDLAYDSGSPLQNAPRLLGKVHVSTLLPWAGLRAGLEWLGESSRLSRDGTWLRGHGVSNLHLSTDALAPGLELSLTLLNLFDKRYAHPGADSNWQNAIEQDGRGLRAGLRWRL